MLLAMTMDTESIVAVGAVLSATTGALVVIFRLLMTAKDTRIQQLEAEVLSYKEIAKEAVGGMEAVADRHAKALGKQRVAPLAPVVPEHSSPTTMAQQAIAELQTTRARLVAATLELGLPARTASPMERQTKGSA